MSDSNNPLLRIMMIILPLLSALGIVGVSVVQEFQATPKEFYNGVGIRYSGTATTAWSNLDCTIDTALDFNRQHYPKDADKLNKVWIEIVGAEDKLTSSYVPSGQVNGKDITGTMDVESYIFGFKKHPILKVRQRAINGKPMPASSSALWHEWFEHYLPFTLHGDLNWEHKAEYVELDHEVVLSSLCH